MIRIFNKKECCGCGACAQLCPRNCIEMKPDEEGFLYPAVNEQECTDCGACSRVCPIASAGAETAEDAPTCYAAWSRNERQRLESSSGGVFSLLAEQVFAQGGRVYGAAYDDRMQVCHIPANNEEELARLRGSKYVQSRIGDAFQKARSDLREGKPVLFSGTACQIAGLKCFLGRDYPNLYLVDVLCHGVPSPKVWEKYLAWQQRRHGKSPVRKVSLRSKDTGWRSYSVKLDFENDRTYSRKHGYDAYMDMFLSDICLRPSCHECRFKSLHRPSDLTLGDAWGIEKLLPEKDDDKGVSLVFVHTAKGGELLRSIMGGLEYRQVDGNQALPPVAYSRRSAHQPPNRETFFEGINSLEWEKEFQRTESRKRLAKLKARVKSVLTGIRR